MPNATFIDTFQAIAKAYEKAYPVMFMINQPVNMAGYQITAVGQSSDEPTYASQVITQQMIHNTKPLDGLISATLQDLILQLKAKPYPVNIGQGVGCLPPGTYVKAGTAAPLKDSNFKADYYNIDWGTTTLTPSAPAKPAASPQPTKPLTFNDLYAKELGLASKDTPIKGWSETKSMADMDMDEALQKAISSTQSMEWLIPEKYLTSSKPPLHEVPSLKSVIVDLMKEDISNASKATDEVAQTAEPSFAAGQYPGNLKDALADMLKKDLEMAAASLNNLLSVEVKGIK